jgi:hypothetical protein
MQTKTNSILSWGLRIIAALIMLQTLYFKFSGAEESIYIFTQMQIEPWGRFATGIAELVAAILLLYPATIAIGALLGVGIMSGALLSHIAVLGIEVKDDGGQLFIYALLVWVSCAILAWMNRAQLLDLLKRLKKG